MKNLWFIYVFILFSVNSSCSQSKKVIRENLDQISLGFENRDVSLFAEFMDSSIIEYFINSTESFSDNDLTRTYSELFKSSGWKIIAGDSVAKVFKGKPSGLTGYEGLTYFKIINGEWKLVCYSAYAEGLIGHCRFNN